MNKILSQEEIDALLATVATKHDSRPESQRTNSGSVQVYDFKHPERISKEQVRTLRTIHDSFARMFGTYLSTNLRSLVDVNLLSIDQVTYSEYTLSLSVPNALYTIKFKELEGKALLEISPQFLLFLVDRLLGGSGDTDLPLREISVIEQNVVRRVIQNIITQLNDVWRQVYPIEAALEGFEADPQFVQIARASDTLAIIFFDIKVRDATFTMNIAFPDFVLEPFLNRLTAQSMMALTGKKARGDERESIQERLRAGKLPVQALLATTAVSVKDFMEFEVDDLLMLEKRTNELMPILVGGKLKFLGTPGKTGRRVAVRIVREAGPDEETNID